jgi:hypothetical protein
MPPSATPDAKEIIMFMRLSPRMAMLAIFLVALTAPAVSSAQDFQDSDTREINNYVLTESGLAKYSQATRNLAALPNRCDKDEKEGAKSLDEAAAALDSVPEVRTAIRSTGMTTREYLVFSFSMFQNGMAAWALSQPSGTLPPGTSMANVNFYRAHEAAIQKRKQ